ncbi:MAG: dipicolinate synthase subunit DpsA [Ruminiclostridium sp.]
MKSFIFIGGDSRSIYAAEKLGERYSCTAFGIAEGEKLPESLSDYAVLPLPASIDGIHINCPLLKTAPPPGFDILEKTVKRGGTVFTSKEFPALRETCLKNGFSLVNYFEREELAVKNAVPTAEGALEIAIRELPVTLFGAEVLITGFGRIAKLLVRYFSALGAKVSAAARKYGDLAWIETYGAKPVNFNTPGEFETAIKKADIIINTVPAVIFDRKRLTLIKTGALFIELASVMSAEDEGLAADRSIKLIWARSLPGKTAPITAGHIIADTIGNIIAERSVADA